MVLTRTSFRGCRGGARACLFGVLLLALAACATFEPGAPPSGVGGGPVSAPATQDLGGTLRNVDHANRRLVLDVEAGGQVDVVYDADTRVSGAADADALAPGDRVRVRASREGRLWRAQAIEQQAAGASASASATAATRDDAPADTAAPDASETAERSGAVSAVDLANRTIVYTEGGVTGGMQRARYDAATSIEFRGQPYPARALGRGDMIRLRLRRSERGWIAERVVVETRAQDR